MRTFRDAQGGEWQVALMDGSHGNVELIFGRIGSGEVLQRTLDAEVANLGEATQLVAELDEVGLQAYLAEATPWG